MVGRSSREPAVTQNPSVTLRTDGIRSESTRRPEANSVRSISDGRPRPAGRPAVPALAGARRPPPARRRGPGGGWPPGSRFVVRS